MPVSRRRLLQALTAAGITGPAALQVAAEARHTVTLEALSNASALLDDEPALVVQCGFSAGARKLPITIMFYGRPFDEASLFRADHARKRLPTGTSSGRRSTQHRGERQLDECAVFDETSRGVLLTPLTRRGDHG